MLALIDRGPKNALGNDARGKARNASEGLTIAQSTSEGESHHADASRRDWWTERGSKRLIYDEAGLPAAIWYVIEGQ